MRPNFIVAVSVMLLLAVSIGLGPVVGQANQQVRFDELVRADFFAGVGGDPTALGRAMTLIEETLARNPRHAEALVWHGSGLLFQAGQHFQKGELPKGVELWERGLGEMDAAVEMESENVGVLIPRGATLLEASKNIPDQAESRSLLLRGIADYEKVLELQASYFKSLSVHARGELLFGLAEGLHRSGDTQRSRLLWERLINETQDSVYAIRAAEWLRGSAPATRTGCVGCHTK
jgi:hypothetical protein